MEYLSRRRNIRPKWPTWANSHVRTKQYSNAGEEIIINCVWYAIINDGIYFILGPCAVDDFFTHALYVDMCACEAFTIWQITRIYYLLLGKTKNYCTFTSNEETRMCKLYPRLVIGQLSEYAVRRYINSSDIYTVQEGCERSTVKNSIFVCMCKRRLWSRDQLQQAREYVQRRVFL